MQAQKNEAFQFDQWDLLKKHYKEREREKERERDIERERDRERGREREVYINIYAMFLSLSVCLKFVIDSDLLPPF